MFVAAIAVDLILFASKYSICWTLRGKSSSASDWQVG